MTFLAMFLFSSLVLGSDTVYREAPKVLQPKHETISLETPVKFFDGRPVQLKELLQKFSGIVFAARDPDCPVSRTLAPHLHKLETDFKKDIAFVYVVFDKYDAKKSIQKDIKQYGFQGPYIADSNFELNTHLKMKTTTEVLLINKQGQITYRGAATDAAGIGYQKKQAPTPFLRNALTAFLSGQPISKSRTSAPGCLLGGPKVTKTPTIDFMDVRHIFAAKCVRCHHEKGVGPFSLRSFKQIYNRRGMIKFVVGNKIMPPWFADDHVGPFKNNYDLTDAERGKLIGWINAGAPNKTSSDDPIPAPKIVRKTRDRLFHFKDIEIPPTGFIPYKYLTVRVGNKQPIWIHSLMVDNKEPKSLHHAVFNSYSHDKGYFVIGGAVPGTENNLWENGIGILLPANAVITIQVHYTAIGRKLKDSLTFGFDVLKKPPEKRIFVTIIEDKEFLLPANTRKTLVNKEYIVQEPKTLAAVAPHMHYRGTRFVATAHFPNGKKKILYSGRYDFNWQPLYKYASPIEIPAGTKISIQGTFDNSQYNLSNPDPNKDITYGESSTDEMMALVCVWIEDAKSI